MAQVQFLDDLVREYLLFRGFIPTLRSFDSDLRSDKEKGFRVDKVMEHALACIQAYDLSGLRELWQHLNLRMFSRLEFAFLSAVKKMEASLLKLYLVNAVQNSKQDKVNEFFSSVTPEIQSNPEWRDWFCFPFVKNPEEHQTFSVYFTRQWQETLMVSLHNFLSVINQSMPLPTLSSYEDEVSKIAKLQEENEAVKAKLLASLHRQGDSVVLGIDDIRAVNVPSPPDIMDDFGSIAQETPSAESQLKIFKNLIRNLGGGFPTSPVPARRSTNKKSERGPRSGENRSSSRSSQSTAVNKAGQSHQPLKRLSQSVPPSNQRAVSPPSTPLASTAPFLVLGQEEVYEHRGVVSHCRFNSSGSYFASADMVGEVRIWSLPCTQDEIFTWREGVKLVATVGPSKAGVTAMDWGTRREHLLMYGTKGGKIRFYDVKERKPVYELSQENQPLLKDKRIMHLCCSPNESSLVISLAQRTSSGDRLVSDGRLLLFDLKTMKIDRSLSSDTQGSVINCCRFNHSGQLLLAGTADGKLQIYDFRSSNCIASWSSHESDTSTIQLRNDENACYSTGADNRLVCWSLLQTGKKLWESPLSEHATGPFTLPKHPSYHRPYGSLFSVDTEGDFILTTSQTGGIIYKVKENDMEQVLSMGSAGNTVVTVDWYSATTSSSIVTGGLDGKLRMSTLLTQ